MPQLALLHMIREALPHKAGRKPGPHHIGKVHRNVVEDSHANARIVRRRDESDAGAETGPEYPDALITPRAQPIHTRPRIHHRLPQSVDGTAHVTRDMIIG